MSDNFNHIDDAFTDYSWSEMKKLLDREIPVRVIPFFWFRKKGLWLLLLLIPIGAAWGFHYFGMPREAANPPVEVQPMPVPSPAVQPVASLEPEEKCDEPTRNLVPGSSNPVAHSTHKSFIQEENPIAPIVSSTSADIRHLSTPAYYPVSSNHPTLESSPPIQVSQPVPAKKKWAIGLETGPFASAGFRFGGASGGVRIQRSFGQSAWGMQTGIGYSNYSRPFAALLLRERVELTDLANQTESLVDPPSFDVNSSVEAYASSTDSIVSRLHFLDIPLVATYQAGKRWQLYAGGGISFLLASQTESGTDGGSGLLRLKTEFGADNAPVTGLPASTLSPNVKVLNPYLEGGVTFFPTKRIGISAQVDAGLRDLLSNWPGDQYINKAQLKVSYWFR
ncbi:MAG: outer membrane beta-barrel protein [Saprospirales bacterium]|nr:outer membrane beta-barrel protein [Saprospirales bacterium]